jgi:hypothetical protein
MIYVPGRMILGRGTTMNNYTIDQIITLLQSLKALVGSQDITITITVPGFTINGIIKT